MRITAYLALVLLALAGPGRAQTSAHTLARTPVLTPASAPAADPSLEFVPNRGQWPGTVRYAAAVTGGHLCLEAGGLRYVLLTPIEHPHLKAPAANDPVTSAAPTSLPTPKTAAPVRGHQLRVRFVEADTSAALEPTRPSGEVRHYLHGTDPARWATAVPGFRQVRYAAPWPGIGARFYENATQHLEYDFEVSAGADPNRVRLRYEGPSSLRLSADGQLHVGTSVGELTELRPHAYQTDPATGQRQPVACRYRLRPVATATGRTELTGADGEVSFELGRYDHARPLVIDPTVIFSTYSGAQGSNWGFTATYDAAGNLYSGGIVLDDMNALPSFPNTPGAFQTTFGAIIDIALIKYNTSVSGPAARVWATYLGGNRGDFPSSLDVNEQGELVVLGSTSSTNYPTTRSAVQRAFGGGQSVSPFGDTGQAIYQVTEGSDIVVTRLSADGSTLLASTYLGGSGNDGIAAYQASSTVRQLPQNYGDPFRGDLAIDKTGNVYLASVSGSPNFPTTAGSFGATYRGGTCDAVVVKLAPAFDRLVWSGYLGGLAADAAYSIQLDPQGRVYVAGGTLSPNLPVSVAQPGAAGAYQASPQGNVDGFVARLAADGSAVQRATYLGTSAYDQAYFVQLGSDGGVYLLGQTLGNWPVSAGTYRDAGSRQFIQKLSPDLDRSLLSTVFGSGRATIDISPTAFLVDQCDRVYASGWGGQVNQILGNGYTHGMATTANAVRRAPDNPTAGSDFYLAQFSAGLTELSYATYYGDPTPNSEGDHVDGGTSRFDPRGVVYAAACSCFNRTGFPVPPGANTYSASNGSVPINGTGIYCNNAAFKLNFETITASVGPPQTLCANAAPVALGGGSPAGGTWSGPGVSGSLAAGFFFTPSPALAGVQVLTYLAPGVVAACAASAQLTITVNAPVVATAAALAPVCAGSGPVALSGSPAGGTWSGPGVSGSVAAGFVFTPTLALVGPQTLTYTPPALTACATGSTAATAVITVLFAVPVSVPPDTVICPDNAGAVIRLRATPAGGIWAGPGLQSGAGSSVFVAPGPGTYALTYTVNAGTSCPVTATRRFTQLADPALVPVAQPLACPSAAGAAPTGGTAPSDIAPYTVQFSTNPAPPAGAVLSWNFGDGSAVVTGPSVAHVYAAGGTYQPTLTVRLGPAPCPRTYALAPITVRNPLVPNVITPNGDNQNDLFKPRLGGCPPRLQVFSRWGRLVHDDPAYRGTWGAAGLAGGLYYYLLSFDDSTPAVKGWVEVIR